MEAKQPIGTAFNSLLARQTDGSAGVERSKWGRIRELSFREVNPL